MSDSITLKWGTLKAWNVKTPAAQELLERYLALGSSMSAAMQRDTPEQRRLLCELIDASDCESVYLDWDAREVSKQEAKDYINYYGTQKAVQP